MMDDIHSDLSFLASSETMALRAIYGHMIMHDVHEMGMISDQAYKKYLADLMQSYMGDKKT